jgi:hypothetical protein
VATVVTGLCGALLAFVVGAVEALLFVSWERRRHR